MQNCCISPSGASAAKELWTLAQETHPVMLLLRAQGPPPQFAGPAMTSAISGVGANIQSLKASPTTCRPSSPRQWKLRDRDQLERILKGIKRISACQTQSVFPGQRFSALQARQRCEVCSSRHTSGAALPALFRLKAINLRCAGWDSNPQSLPPRLAWPPWAMLAVVSLAPRIGRCFERPPENAHPRTGSPPDKAGAGLNDVQQLRGWT